MSLPSCAATYADLLTWFDPQADLLDSSGARAVLIVSYVHASIDCRFCLTRRRL